MAPKTIQREKTEKVRLYASTHAALMKELAKRLRKWEQDYKKDPDTPKPWLADIVAEKFGGSK